LLQLLQVVELTADAHPVGEAAGVAPRPEEGQLVVAEQHLAVGAVARIAQGADSECAAVDQVAQEDCPPALGWVGSQRLEQPLQVAVDVADDQDREIGSGQSVRRRCSPAPVRRRTARVWEAIVCCSVRAGWGVMSRVARANSTLKGRARSKKRLRALPRKTQKLSHSWSARARRTWALASHQPGPGSAVTSANVASTSSAPTRCRAARSWPL